ncbi:MAG: hypothetical protein RIR17_936, partial [Planctomycetota bacterium]
MDRGIYWMIICMALLGMVTSQTHAARPMQIEDLFRFLRLTDAQISPDGAWVAYVVTKVDLEGNK